MPELARCTSAVAIAEEATTPKATFYDWVTPVGVTESSKIKKSRRKLAVALSHPVLRAVVSNEQEPEERREEQQRQQFTPLSKRVATENLARDARIGEAYAARREQLKKAGKLFEVIFDKEGPLGFKILLARGQRSTRRRVVVDATFETCIAFNVIRPRDEIVAVDGDLLIEMDPEAFAELVRRLRNKRPLALTFAKGEGRDKAFREQCEEAGKRKTTHPRCILPQVALLAFSRPRPSSTPSSSTACHGRRHQRTIAFRHISAAHFVPMSQCPIGNATSKSTTPTTQVTL